MQLIYIALLAVGCLLASDFVSASTSAAPNVDSIETLAQTVCETARGTKKQLTHIHQANQLVQFFHKLEDGDKLSSCRQHYLKSLEELEHLLSSYNDDACGEQKIRLIEAFHRKYVSKVGKHLKERKRAHREAPKMVKLFFMQYANKISSICEQSAASVLARYHENSLNSKEDFEGLKKIMDIMGLTDLSKGYKEVYLFWNMVDSLSLQADKKFSKYLTNADDQQEFRVNVQMHDGRPLRAIQTVCRLKMRPIYSKSILPVLRLVDMGYYPPTQEGKEVILNNPMFITTQLCETLLKVRIFDDDKLTSDQFVALKMDEAAQLAKPKELAELAELELEEVEIATKQSVAQLDLLVSQEEAQASAKRIKANVASRGRVFGRMLRRIVSQLKAKFGSKLGAKIKLFKRGGQGGQHLEAVNVEELDEQSLERISSSDEDGQVSRRKRSDPYQDPWWWDLSLALGMFAFGIYWIILFLVKAVVLFIPSIVLLVAHCFGHKKALKYFKFMWKLGFDPEQMIPKRDWKDRPKESD